jgi:hypothetical protein
MDADWELNKAAGRDALLTWAPSPEMFVPQTPILDAWYKGSDFHRLPAKDQMRGDGLPAIFEGWQPPEPIIQESTRVLALGSCFASYFILWLGDHGFNKTADGSPYDMLIRYNAALETAAVIAQQFRWAFEEMDSANALWVDPDKQVVEATRERQRLVRTALETADVLIITLGLSELWYDRTTNEPLWRAIPLSQFDTDRHAFKVLSVADTVAALETIERLRVKNVPRLKIVYTVSPVRLRATFRPVSALTANSASKAIVRAALDEFLRAHWAQVGKTYFYFPSYELVLDVFQDSFESDNQHVYASVVARVLDLFARWYTALPVDEPKSTPGIDAANGDELAVRLAQLEARTTELQRVCDDRQRVIEDLAQAAAQRLDVIQQLDAACKHYQQMLGQLPGSEP